MPSRRAFLKRTLELGAGGLYTGFVSGCASSGGPLSEPPSTSSRSPAAPVRSAAPPTTANATPGTAQAGAGNAGSPGMPAATPPSSAGPGELVPPPELFDASLLDVDFWLKPRTISLYRPATNEQLSVLYWKDGEVKDGSYEQLCHILRDVQAAKAVQMDPKLIETLWACQAFCARYGIKHPIHVLSGYRTPATNDRLIEVGLPAARKSLHLDGKAADIRIIDLNTEILGGLVRSFERGGVGFYFRPGTTGGWIHTDTGVNRIWHG